MGILKHFLSSKGINLQVKYWVYLARPLNCLLSDANPGTSWKNNKERLRSFHHSAIRRILGITWTRVREERITNDEVRYHFLQIPDLDAFIIWCTARYMGKVCRSEDRMTLKKLLGAWIQHPYKTGKPQYSCNNNLLNAIHACLPELTKDVQGLFKKWTQLSMEEEVWNSWIQDFFILCQSEFCDEMEQDEITQCASTCMQNLRFDTESVQ